MSGGGGWFAADGEAWECDLETRARPLNEHTVRLDLRHLENQVRAGGRFPARRELCARWGWTDKAVRIRLASNDWHDPNRPVDVDSILASRRAPFQRRKKGPSEGPTEGPARGPQRAQPDTVEPTQSVALGPSEGPTEGPRLGPSEGPHARSISEPENQGTKNQLQRAREDTLPAESRPRTLLSTVWEAINRLYVDSGHGNVPLDLDSSGRREALEKCLRALHRDPLVAARALVKVLAFWLYGPSDWHRVNLHGSELIAALLRPTKIGGNHTKAESWVWDGEVRARAGPSGGPATDPRKQSNASRQIAQLLRNIEEEDPPNGIEENHPESDSTTPGLRLLQRTP